MRREKQRVFQLDDETWGRFVRACRDQDLSASQVLRRLVREFLETGGKAAPVTDCRRGKKGEK